MESGPAYLLRQGIAAAKMGQKETARNLLTRVVEQDERNLTLITYWRAGDPIVTPLQMFVHVLRPDGSIAAQQDRLDVPAYGWRSGDVIAQVHHIALPPDIQSPEIAIGLYNPATNVRLPVTVEEKSAGDRLLLSEVRP